MQIMEEMAEHVGMNYPEIPDPRYVAQPVNGFLFLREEEMGSAENPITIDKDDGFSENVIAFRRCFLRQQPQVYHKVNNGGLWIFGTQKYGLVN